MCYWKRGSGTLRCDTSGHWERLVLTKTTIENFVFAYLDCDGLRNKNFTSATHGGNIGWQ